MGIAEAIFVFTIFFTIKKRQFRNLIVTLCMTGKQGKCQQDPDTDHAGGHQASS
jgi:hypothetical protein